MLEELDDDELREDELELDEHEELDELRLEELDDDRLEDEDDAPPNGAIEHMHAQIRDIVLSECVHVKE